MKTGLTQEDYETLMQAAATGATSISFADGRAVSYKSTSEMLRVAEIIRRQYEKPLRTRYPIFESGL